MDLQAAVAIQAAAEVLAGRAADLAGSAAEVPAEVGPAGAGNHIFGF